MSIQQMKVAGNVLHPILAIGFINFILTIVLVIMSATVFAKPSGIVMEFQTFNQDMGLSGKGVVITVTSENVIYIDNRVVTLNELRRFLAQGGFRKDALMVKIDPHASMGRVADILELCRGIAGASVNVSTIL